MREWKNNKSHHLRRRDSKEKAARLSRSSGPVCASRSDPDRDALHGPTLFGGFSASLEPRCLCAKSLKGRAIVSRAQGRRAGTGEASQRFMQLVRVQLSRMIC